MSSERRVDPFAALVLVISVIGIILIAALSFAGFYLTGPYSGNRYSCLDCEYSTPGDLAAQIIMLILFIIQLVVVLNDLLPNKFIQKNLDIYGMLLAGLTIIFAIIGIASFGIKYVEFEWWPEVSFYGSIIAGILNLILFFLKYKNR